MPYKLVEITIDHYQNLLSGEEKPREKQFTCSLIYQNVDEYTPINIGNDCESQV